MPPIPKVCWEAVSGRGGSNSTSVSKSACSGSSGSGSDSRMLEGELGDWAAEWDGGEGEEGSKGAGE